MILETINSPADVKRLSEEDAARLCQELRRFLVEQVSRTGGHLASNLGVVELTVAIHRVYDTASDRLVLDVGHQCYVHKALTGRRELFGTLRQIIDAAVVRLTVRAHQAATIHAQHHVQLQKRQIVQQHVKRALQKC